MESEILPLWPAEHGLANNDWFGARDYLWGNLLPKQGCHHGNAKSRNDLYPANSNDRDADCGFLLDGWDC